MYQLSSIWGRGNSKVRRLPQRDRGAPDLQEGITRHLWAQGGIEPGVRPLPFRAQWTRLPAGQIRAEEFRSQTDWLCITG